MKHRTNKEIAAVYAPGPKCAGPFWLDVAQRQRAVDLRESLVANGDPKAFRLRLETLNGVIGRMASVRGGFLPLPPDDATLPELVQAWVKIQNSRKECRTDLGPLMAKEPFDGMPHKLACPNCGTPTEWTPELSAENAARRDQVLQGELERALTL